MADRKGIESVIKNFLEELGDDIVGRRVKKYIVDELESGRYLSDIIKDNYVKNRISDERAKEIITNSEVIKAVEDNLRMSLKGE